MGHWFAASFVLLLTCMKSSWRYVSPWQLIFSEHVFYKLTGVCLPYSFGPVCFSDLKLICKWRSSYAHVIPKFIFTLMCVCFQCVYVGFLKCFIWEGSVI